MHCVFCRESCSEVPEGDCDAIGGIFLGTGTLCATGGCEPEQPGACCIGSDGTCTELDANTCLLAEGNFVAGDQVQAKLRSLGLINVGKN